MGMSCACRVAALVVTACGPGANVACIVRDSLDIIAPHLLLISLSVIVCL